MKNLALNYPVLLDRVEIEQLIPHRGEIFVCQRLIIKEPNHFIGTASWKIQSAIIQGHFPGLPIVPGVFLIEAMAQLAGAGLLASDDYVKSLPNDLVGVLAAIRKCKFKRPVLPEREVDFAIQCRQLTTLGVQVSATVTIKTEEVAQLDIMMAYAPRQQLTSIINN